MKFKHGNGIKYGVLKMQELQLQRDSEYNWGAKDCRQKLLLKERSERHKGKR